MGCGHKGHELYPCNVDYGYRPPDQERNPVGNWFDHPPVGSMNPPVPPIEPLPIHVNSAPPIPEPMHVHPDLETIIGREGNFDD